MPNLTEKDDQLLECLPDPLTIQIALLKKWCIDHNWSNFEITREFKICAVPPGVTRQIPLPEDAWAEIERNKELIDTLQAAQACQQDMREGRQHLVTGLILSLPCFGVSILTNTNAVKSVPAALIVPTEIKAEFNLLTPGITGALLIFALVNLLRYWKYRCLKNKLAQSCQLALITFQMKLLDDTVKGGLEESIGG